MCGNENANVDALLAFVKNCGAGFSDEQVKDILHALAKS